MAGVGFFSSTVFSLAQGPIQSPIQWVPSIPWR